MEYLQRLVSQSLIHEEAFSRAQAHRDPPAHGIVRANKAVSQHGLARNAVSTAGVAQRTPKTRWKIGGFRIGLKG